MDSKKILTKGGAIGRYLKRFKSGNWVLFKKKGGMI